MRTRIPFDGAKAYKDPTHFTKLLVQLERQKHFCSSDGHVSVQGIIISFMKKQKLRDIDNIDTTIPESFKSIPIHVVDLPDKSTEPILDTIKVSEEWRQNQETTGRESSAQQTIKAEKIEWFDNTKLTSAQSTEDKKIMRENSESYTVEASHKTGLTSSEETTLLGSPKHAEELLDSRFVSPSSSSPTSVEADMQPSNNMDKLIEMLERHTQEVQEVTHKVIERLDSMDARNRDSERQIMKKLESMVVRIKGLEGHLELLSQGHLTIATGNEDMHTVRYSSAAATIAKSFKGLPCTIHPAPPQVVGIQDLFIERLQKALLEENFTLADDPEGSAVAFAVNGSRLESDLKRDLKNVPSRSRTMLVVIKPTMNPQYKPERLKPANLGFPWVEEAVVILVDFNNTELLVCDTNANAVKALIWFLKKESLPTKESTGL